MIVHPDYRQVIGGLLMSLNIYPRTCPVTPPGPVSSLFLSSRYVPNPLIALSKTRTDHTVFDLASRNSLFDPHSLTYPPASSSHLYATSTSSSTTPTHALLGASRHDESLETCNTSIMWEILPRDGSAAATTAAANRVTMATQATEKARTARTHVRRCTGGC